MDACLAVASKRDQRDYAETPVREDAVRRILDAGRIAGSSKNGHRGGSSFRGPRAVAQVAQTGYAPPSLLGARW